MSMKRWIVVVWAVMVACGLAVAAEESKKKDKNHESPDGTSENIFYATYMAKAGPIEAVVSSYGASYEEDSDHFMLQVAVGVVGEVKNELDFSDKSFTLLDADGNLYAMAPPAAVENETKLLDYAQEMQRNEPIQLGKDFDNLEKVESEFYQTEREIAWASVHIRYNSYFSDVLFFPKPKDGLNGVLTLNVLTTGMEEPVEVHFKVPEPKSDHGESETKNKKKS